MDAYLIILVIMVLASGFYLENYSSESNYIRFIGLLEGLRVLLVIVIIIRIIDLTNLISIALSIFFLVYTAGKIIFRRNPVLLNKPVYHYFKIGTYFVFFFFLIYFLWSIAIS